VARFTFSLPDELNKWLSSEAQQKEVTKNSFLRMMIADYRSGADFTLCGKYRVMILQLLRYGEGIPRQVRLEAYDLLDEAFEDD
jgi:hypothetical protein